ncbi:MAG: DUF3185 family protein [Phycisphaerae bacterium]|nr:DUF3185 family protein [Phycisphaerae bacterium]
MNSQRIAGIVLLVVGLILFFVGLHASHSIVNQTKNFFVGHFTFATTMYIFGGLALAIAGLLMTVFGARRA